MAIVIQPQTANTVDVPKATVQVVYNQKDISRSLDADFISLHVTDKLNGESDELEITLHDAHDKWSNDWYAGKGDTLAIKITDELGTLDAGTFEIDEIEISGHNPQTVTIKGLATGVSHPLRTKNNTAHDNSSLAKIARHYAQKHGLTLVGKIKDIPIERSTQYQETDIAYLKRLADQYGYVVTIKKKQLIFSEIASLKTLPTHVTVHKQDLSSYRITDKIREVAKSAKQTSTNAQKRKTHKSHKQADQSGDYLTSSDQINSRHHASNDADASLQSQAKLDKANNEKTTGDISFCRGRTDIKAGKVVDLQGFGVLSGRYQLSDVSHTVDRSGGYYTESSIKRIDTAPVLSKTQKLNHHKGK